MNFTRAKIGLILLSAALLGTMANANIEDGSPTAPNSQEAYIQIQLNDPIVTVPISNQVVTPEVQDLLFKSVENGTFELHGILIFTPDGGIQFTGKKSEFEKLKKEINRLKRRSGDPGGGDGTHRSLT